MTRWHTQTSYANNANVCPWGVFKKTRHTFVEYFRFLCVLQFFLWSKISTRRCENMHLAFAGKVRSRFPRDFVLTKKLSNLVPRQGIESFFVRYLFYDLTEFTLMSGVFCQGYVRVIIWLVKIHTWTKPSDRLQFFPYLWWHESDAKLRSCRINHLCIMKCDAQRLNLEILIVTSNLAIQPEIVAACSLRCLWKKWWCIEIFYRMIRPKRTKMIGKRIYTNYPRTNQNKRVHCAVYLKTQKTPKKFLNV